MFYPRWWLEAVGYFDTPPNHDPAAILFAPFSSSDYFSNNTLFQVISSFILSGILFLCVGFYLGKRSSLTQNNYERIPEQFNINL